MKLKINSLAPNFLLYNQDEKQIELYGLKSDFIILYFYPKDNTPGCAIESKGFSSAVLEFKKFNARIFGISGLDEKSKKKFCSKHDLKIDLLADKDFSVSKKYGVFVEKNFMGKKFLGIKRTTFVLDKNKRILKIYEKVVPYGHEKEVLSFIEEACNQKC